MSSYKVSYENNHGHTKAQVEGIYNGQCKTKYNISFEGTINLTNIESFVSLLIFRSQDMKYLIKRISINEYIECGSKVYKINYCNTKELEDVLEIELNVEAIHPCSL